ncbi:MAG: ATP-binding protein [Leptospiraceae bacterium]|nr:ATP-binding protein [Leptospiraceae bacterium]
MKPVIDFEHVLSELSINRKDPCEVIRELISNSYDAKAQNIYYFPILERKGFIFIDDGLGLDTKNEIKGITPYSAFFSIGKSTKTPGAGIGYKCQGSKLCFACSKFVVISKTTSDTNWYYKELDNPQSNLTIDTDISPLETQNPWNILENIFRNSDNITEPILKSIKNNILNKLKQGTIIIVLEFKTPDFSKYFESPSLQGKNSKERNYLYNYIRFYSKHGDIRILKTEQDFPADKIKAFKSIHGVNSNLSLYMWIGGSLEKIPAGFPYIENGDKEKPHSPANVSRLTDGPSIQGMQSILLLVINIIRSY